MNPLEHWNALPEDIQVLRSLIARKKELAQDPLQSERKELWSRHAALKSQRPMILAETQGVLDELIPLDTLRCREPWAREMERALRDCIFRLEQVQDDWVVEPYTDYAWEVNLGSYGVERVLVHGQNEGKLGSYHWDAPIRDLDHDLDRLHIRQPAVDRAKTHAWKSFLEQHFGDVLPVRLRGSYWWTTGLTWEAINLIGLEGLMLAMYDSPDGLHRLMALLRDDFMHLLDWFEAENLLTLNNENDYVGSGSIGYTGELGASVNGRAVKTSDLWGLSESQETVGVSPRLFEEFIFPYQLPVIRRFGLSYYGCCEPVHRRIHILKRIPNLRRISISPWCDQTIMAREIGQDYIFCRKPNPAIISTSTWDEEAIREDLRTTLRAAQDCPLELVMKDVHTVSNQPWRLGHWVALAREVCAEFGFT